MIPIPLFGNSRLRILIGPLKNLRTRHRVKGEESDNPNNNGVKFEKKLTLSEEEKTKRRKEAKTEYNLGRISIGNEVLRWRTFQKKKKFRSYEETASFLLDHIANCDGEQLKQKKTATTSTPGKAASSVGVFDPQISGISSISSETESAITTITEEKTLSDEEATLTAPGTDVSHASGQEMSARCATDPGTREKGHGMLSNPKFASFIDPFNLSIDVTHIEDEDEDIDDPDFKPRFNFEAVLPDEVNRKYDEVTFEEEAFGEEGHNEEEEEELTDDGPLSPGVHWLRTEADSVHLIGAPVCFAYISAILTLARINVVSCVVKGCTDPTNIIIKDNFIGSAMYLKWVCGAGHILNRWCAQPVLNRGLHGGDLMFALSTLTSGNNFGKLALWAKHMNFKIMSSTSFHKMQRTYLIPTVDSYWAKQQSEILSSFKDQKLIVMGDGRNDSPGHSAQYCSYTFMEYDSKKILTLQTLDKRSTGRKSTNMEKLGFQQAVTELCNKNIEMEEIVTDAHLGIGSIMKTKYPEIKHSHDIWHAAKNLGKQLGKIVKKKANQVLIPWQKDIVNHFWFACNEANSYEEFLSIWRGVLHHITNKHEWVLSQGTGIYGCLHEPLDEREAREKPWLSTSDHAGALHDLSAVILDKRFLGKISYYRNYRTTADIEVFHQLILMYCAKRFAYSPPVYRIRNLLAAIDHNHHISRPLKTNKNGEIRYYRCYNKKSNRWSVFPVKEMKTYGYVAEMATMLFNLRIHDKVGMGKPMVLEEGDLRRLSKHLAPESPQSTSVIVQTKRTRIRRK